MADVSIDAIGNTPDEFEKIIGQNVAIARSAVEAAGLLRTDPNK